MNNRMTERTAKAMKETHNQPILERLSDGIVKVKASSEADIIIFISRELQETSFDIEAVSQLVNVSSLPGVVSPVIGMPDIHWGYGFPIGGVAGFDVDKGGVISPGGVGFDVNCGVRLLRTNLLFEEVKGHVGDLLASIFSSVPTGLGREANVAVSRKDFFSLLAQGAQWVVGQGKGEKADLLCCEEGGCMFDADADVISKRAIERGRSQVGSLGAGNHFLELQEVEDVFDEKAARTMGLFKGQLVVMIHTGSRGFGHQVCSDFVKEMLSAMDRYRISVADKQLACAPFYSKEGQRYWKAMCCAANFAWANRQMLTHLVREAFERVFNECWRSLGIGLVYDVAHNIAKIERHKVGGSYRTLCVHRKGATRAFAPHTADLPEVYAEIGQPVLVPGNMGSRSYVLSGTRMAMEVSLGSCCHGAGRTLSRREALRQLDYASVVSHLQGHGVNVMSHSRRTVVEEAPSAYKDISQVVDTVVRTGIGKLVASMRPVGVIKG